MRPLRQIYGPYVAKETLESEQLYYSWSTNFNLS
jgi:hypothetical protein